MDFDNILSIVIGILVGMLLTTFLIDEPTIPRQYSTSFGEKSITFYTKDCQTTLEGDSPFNYTREVIVCRDTFDVDSLHSDSLWKN